MEHYRKYRLLKKIPAFLRNATLGRQNWTQATALKSTNQVPVLEKVKEQAITGKGETVITFSGVEMADMRMLEDLG